MFWGRGSLVQPWIASLCLDVPDQEHRAQCTMRSREVNFRISATGAYAENDAWTHRRVLLRVKMD